MKKSNLTMVSAAVAAILLAVLPSVPAYAALYDGGATYCSAPTPNPRLQAKGHGELLLTPPNSYTRYVGSSTMHTWNYPGTAPGGGWSSWAETVYDYVDLAGTYGQCVAWN